MKEEAGKRRRPRWFGSATVVTWALLWGSPSTACPFRNSRASWLLEEAFCGEANRRPEAKRPLTVFLQGDKKLRRRRRLQFEFAVDDTPSPTFMPTDRPSSAHSFVPSIGPTTPTSVPPPSHTSHRSREGDQSTQVVHIPVISKSNKDPASPTTNQPLLKFAAVPVGFDVLLETDSQQDLDSMALEAKQILQQHLTTAFRQGFADNEGVSMRSVDLNVRTFLTQPSSRRGRMLRQMQRFLQLSRAITLEARGVAGFQVNRNAVETDQFLAKVNGIIDESVKPDRLMSIFQNSTSGLSDFRVASVTNTGKPPEEETNKPSLVEIIIAFILIALMLVSLGAYGYIFYRKRQKRLKRRKQFGVGKTSSPYKGPPRPRPHGASVTPAAPSERITAPTSATSRTPYSPGVVGASSSESSYKGLGSESEDDDADVFAKELRLAASLDRRAWDDFQERTQQVGNRSVESEGGHDPVYNSQNEVYRELSNMDAVQEGIEMQETGSAGYRLPSPPGAVGLAVTGDTVSIQSNSSFPYGDEHDPAEYKPAVYKANTGVLQESNPNNYMNTDVEHDDTNGGWRMTNIATSELNDGIKPSQSSPRPFSFLYHATESKMEPETHSDFPMGENGSHGRQSVENVSDPTSAGAIRGSPMSHSWSTNPRPGSSTENGTTGAIRGSPRVSPRGSPHSSSWNTASRVVSQDGSLSASPGFGSSAAVNEETASAAGSEEDSSLVTADIVKEVQRLSQFVKTYERKKEHRTKRDQERGDDDVNLSSSLTSSMDYDSLMETVASLQNVVDPAPHVSSKGYEIARKVTSSTRSLTPNHSMSNSPERSLSRQIEGIESMQSSDSSDVGTMESDVSRRLGITPFSVQKPLVGYQNPALQDHQVHSISQISTAYYRRADSPREKQQTERESGALQEMAPRFSHKQSGSHSALNSLRHSGGSILDGSMKEGPSDEFTPEVGKALRYSGGSIPKMKEGPSDEFTPEVRRRQDNERPFTGTTTALRDPRTVTPRKRSSGKRFDGIVNMFESKEREPLYPPNESWQYNY